MNTTKTFTMIALFASALVLLSVACPVSVRAWNQPDMTAKNLTVPQAGSVALVAAGEWFTASANAATLDAVGRFVSTMLGALVVGTGLVCAWVIMFWVAKTYIDTRKAYEDRLAEDARQVG